jgi:hypothetical protein
MIEKDHPQADPPEEIEADIAFDPAQAGQGIPIGHRRSTPVGSSAAAITRQRPAILSPIARFCKWVRED